MVAKKKAPKKNAQMAEYGKKAYKSLVKIYGKNYMSELARKGHEKRRQEKLAAERAAKKGAK